MSDLHSEASRHRVESGYQAQFWFDPICPWAWLASRWMTEVQRVRPVDVTWSVMSLAALNEGRDLAEDYQALMEHAWFPARVVSAAAAEHGSGVVKPFYDAIGTRLHPGGEQDFEVAVRDALAEVDLPATLLEAGSVADHDDALRATKDHVAELVGDDVGTPVIAVDSVAFFGPVVTPAPKGEAAGRLWDGCVLIARTPGFYELKRTRTSGPVFD